VIDEVQQLKRVARKTRGGATRRLRQESGVLRSRKKGERATYLKVTAHQRKKNGRAARTAGRGGGKKLVKKRNKEKAVSFHPTLTWLGGKERL